MAKHIKSTINFDGTDKVKVKNGIPVFKSFFSKPIDYSYQKNVSFSQFSIYEQCPHKWFVQYVEKGFTTPPNINLIFGTAIHHVFQHYLKTGYEKSFAAADREDLTGIFQTKLVEEYQEQYNKIKSHFSSASEMGEYYDDGVEIINWFKKKRGAYFTRKGTHLIGIEMPLQKEISKNVIFQGFIDLVMYDDVNDKIKIYDIKTSTKGWNEYAKKDEKKIAQVLLYKQFFSELYDFPIEKIDVEFFILKRKAEPNEYIEFPKRIQTFTPANGKTKLKASRERLDNFIKEAFDSEGKYIIKEHPKNVSKLCEWCPINNTKFCIK
jgi:hypothetical protein